MPRSLYLLKEFCGLPAGTRFTVALFDGVKHAQHRVVGGGVFIVPLGVAEDAEEWFTDVDPAEQHQGRAVGAAIPELGDDDTGDDDSGDGALMRGELKE